MILMKTSRKMKKNEPTRARYSRLEAEKFQLEIPHIDVVEGSPEQPADEWYPGHNSSYQ